MCFNHGDRVYRIGNISRRGTVNGEAELHAGYYYYEIIWDDHHQELVVSHELHQEVIAKTAWDLLRMDAPRDFREIGLASTLYKLRNSNSNTISTLKAARTKFMPYQYKPLLKFLNSKDRRLLVADEVGLGKTIEAGYIMLELAARKSLRSALIVCPKSLKEKWILELKTKFNFRFEDYNRNNLFNAIQGHIDDPSRPVFAIVTYESLRLHPEYDEIGNDIYELIENRNYIFDFIVCDEAHKLRNEDTMHHRGLRRILPNAGGVLFLTATPVMTDLSNLYSLIKLLDPHTFYNNYVFRNAVHFNRPFVNALRQVNAGVPFTRIFQDLDNSVLLQEFVANDEVYDTRIITVGDYYLNDSLYQLLRNKLLSQNYTHEMRVSVQRDLVDFGALNYLYSRTRRVDVAVDFTRPVRNAVTIRYRLGEGEQEIYDLLLSRLDASLASVNTERMLASSLPGYLQRENAGDLIENVQALNFDTKFNFLVNEVVRPYVGEQRRKIVIFSTFIATLEYLNQKLTFLDYQVAIIHGRIRDRDQVIEQFRSDANVNILLSSEVGSEGLDFQFCDTIVNYDLPWNPMVIEQRIGRIDRIGQQSENINIINMVMEGSIEARIHDRLWSRIRLFEQTIGDLEDILGEDEELVQFLHGNMVQFLNRNLTEEQCNNQIERMCLAIEHERLMLIDIGRELENSFSNDLHFQQEIERMVLNNTYISSFDLENLLNAFIRSKFPTFLFVKDESQPNVFILNIPARSVQLLRDFITANLDLRHENPEMHQLAGKFFVRLQGNDDCAIRLTFDSDLAFLNKSLEFISAYHPLVNAICNYFLAEGLERNQFFKVELDSAMFDDWSLNSGVYFHALYNINLRRKDEYENFSTVNQLVSTCFNVSEETPVLLCNDDAVRIFSNVISSSRMISVSLDIDQDTFNQLKSLMNSAIIERQLSIENDEKVRYQSSINRRLRQEIEYLESRNARLLNQMEANVQFNRLNQRRYQEECERIELFNSRIDKASVEASHNLVSLTLIYVS